MIGYFLCVDLLGFSEIIKNLSPEKANSKIESWVALIEELVGYYEIEKYQLVSDTLFIGLGDAAEDLNKIIKFAHDLLNRSIPQSLIIRGSITLGEYVWGKLVYGPAVIKAHTLEKSQNWIGIVLDNDIKIEDVYYIQKIITYPVPMNSNQMIILYNTISWQVPSYSDLASLTCRDGLGGVPGEGKPLNWDWATKISNTVLFGCYSRAITIMGKDRSKFYGLHPVQFVELTLQNIMNS
ncbi:MAG: hypothetical protein WC748_05515 [Legionellales bacterium]|jgi:hypothetical protein